MQDDDTSEVIQLLSNAVPEIDAGVVEITGVARKSGFRSKVAVLSHDPQVDCIGACVGPQGSRIKHVMESLRGERIDLVRWHDSAAQFIANALQPGIVEQVKLYPMEKLAVAMVAADQAALVRGRGDENCRLASQLCGWSIKVEEDD